MDILKTATDWAKAEMFSSAFFILFGVVFIAAGIGFWQLGKTDIAKSYIIPLVVAGSLLMIIGLGLFFTNKARFAEFTEAYNADATAFVESEIDRADKTLKEYKSIVFTAIPLILIVFALLLIFVNTPIWRAISITTMAMLLIILMVDGTAHARIADYKEKLVLVDKP